MTRRAAIYARYSSDLQRDASIDDQLRVCRQLIAREGWNEGEVYTDAAISGATLLRPEYQRMLEDARAGRFDVIVAEGLDRISRDQEHIAAFYKQTSFCGIPVITRAEGEISELHIGLKGTMAALFLKDLAQKTHRGLEGRINEGKSAGGKAYGYRVVKGTDAQGDTLTGELEPVPEEVAVVRRIFKDYATGLSARSIAAALNRDGVPAPGGAEWSFSTISGNWKRGTGILNNELYIGRRLWNRQRFMKDPITGKRQARMNPESEWKVADVPVLRIIEDELWGAVKTRQGALRSVLLSPEGRPRPEQARRPKYLFSGLMKCSCCGARYTLINASTYSCSATRNKGTCANRATIKRNEVERRILEGLKSRLMHPELLAEFVSAYHAEWNLLAAVSSQERMSIEQDLRAVSDQIERIVDAIAAGMPYASLKIRMEELETRRAELEARQAALGAHEAPIRLHPGLTKAYAAKVSELSHALNDPALRTEAVEILRGLVSEIRMVPQPDGRHEIELSGDLAAILALANGENAKARLGAGPAETMVAGAGFEPAAFRL